MLIGGQKGDKKAARGGAALQKHLVPNEMNQGIRVISCAAFYDTQLNALIVALVEPFLESFCIPLLFLHPHLVEEFVQALRDQTHTSVKIKISDE